MSDHYKVEGKLRVGMRQVITTRVGYIFSFSFFSFFYIKRVLAKG